MAAWKLAPALAAGNCVVLKPAEQTRWASACCWNSSATCCRRACSTSSRASAGGRRGPGHQQAHRQDRLHRFHPGRLAHPRARRRTSFPPPSSLGGKSPNIYFEDIMQAEPAFIEGRRGPGAGLLQPGRGVHLPVPRAGPGVDLPGVHGGGAEKVRAIKRGDPLDTETMVGAQASQQQYEKILSYLDIAQQEGAELLAGGSVELEGNLARLATSSRPCSRGTTACACSRRKYSARWSASPPSGRSRGPGHRQRHRVRPRRRPLDPRHQPRLPHGPRDQVVVPAAFGG